MICEAVEALKLKDRTDMDKLCSEYAAIAPLLLAIISPSDTSDKKSSSLLWKEAAVREHVVDLSISERDKKLISFGLIILHQSSALLHCFPPILTFSAGFLS